MPRSDRTKAAILRAARERFAADGYERATIRAIAADAEIDPSMVIRYFGTKERLFDAALTIDLHLPDLAAVPAAEMPATLVRLFLNRWENDPSNETLLALVRSAVTNERAAERVHTIITRQVAPALAAALGPEVASRAALTASQLLGVALTRHLIRLPEVTKLTVDEIAEILAPAIAVTLGIHTDTIRQR